jgi:hypothetical protein
VATLEKYKNDPNVAPDAWQKGRYADNDELKYALRSVQKYAPWVRKVFVLVGDGQPLPGWLNTSASKIRVLRHSEFFFTQDSNLPTFNSLAIEACLHRIQELSDFFVYFNDDMMLGNNVYPSTFFSEWGQPRVWFSDPKLIGSVAPGDEGHTAAEKNSHSLMNYLTHNAGTRTYGMSLMHQCKPLSKMILGKAEDIAPVEFTKMRRAQFRLLNTISAITFSAHLCVHKGECTESKLPSSLFINFNEGENPAYVFDQILSQRPQLICLNNGFPELRHEVTRGLERVYPARSQFEW